MQTKIHIESLFDGRVYEVKVGEDLSPNFMSELSSSMLEILESTPAEAVMILVNAEFLYTGTMRTMPMNIPLIIKTSAWLRHPKVESLIVCTPKDPTIQFIARVVTQSFGIGLQFFSQRSEALQFLQKRF